MSQKPEVSEKMRLLIVSTSKIYGGQYMDYLLEEVRDFFKDASEVLFIPYARPGGISYNAYTDKVRQAFSTIDLPVKGLHKFENEAEALKQAQGIFTGGGNTFLLLKTLYEKQLVNPLREAVRSGTPYMGSSAGSNITGLTIGTTNDMPIVYPPTFEALGFLPFNVNPHYLDPIADSKHQGETREQRIREFHQFNEQPVVGLREGSWLRLENGWLELRGPYSVRLFYAGEEAEEQTPGNMSFLLDN